MEGILKF